MKRTPRPKLATVVAGLFAATLAAAPAHGDVVIDWNAKADAITAEKRTATPTHDRGLAMLHVAMFEAPTGSLSVADVPVWKRITLGIHKQIDSLRAALAVAGIRLGGSADEILSWPAFPLSKKRMDVDLVIVSVSELGFQGSASLADIYWRAAELDLELCPAEVALLLRLQHVNQPVGEFLNIAMRPIAIHGREPMVLSVANAGTGPSLIGGEGRPDLIMNWQARFVFVRPQRIARPDAAAPAYNRPHP